MALMAFHCPGDKWAWKKIADCRKCEHPCFGSLEWVEVVWAETFEKEDHYHDDPMVVSVTETLGCLRKAWYQRTMDYAEAPEKLLARVTGSHMHWLAEMHNIKGSEVAYDHELSRGYRLKGTADVSLPGIVKDYKTVDRPTKSLGGGVRIKEDGTKVHINCEQLSVYADLKELQGEDEVETLEIIQVGRKAIATHDAYRVPGALATCIERAELLIDAVAKPDDDFLPKEGMDIKFFRAKMCDFCPFAGVCQPEV